MYREKVLSYECLPRPTGDHETLLKYATQHRDTVNKLSDKLIGEIRGKNGELKTRNAMGSNWGYHASTSAELYHTINLMRLEGNKRPKVLDIGCGYGIDPL